MTQVNQNINTQYNQQLYKQDAGQGQRAQAPHLPRVARPQPVRIPEFYQVSAVPQQTFKESLDDNMLYTMILKPFVEHPVATIATWLGLGAVIDTFSHACSGRYEDSLVKKAANLGDNIENSKFVQSKPVQTVLDGFRAVGKGGKKAAENSAILRAMKNTPTMPEWEMVKTQMFGQKQEVVLDFMKIVNELKLNVDAPIKLKDIGLDSTEKEMLRKTFSVKKISQIPETQAVNQVLLSRLGKPADEIKKIQALDNIASTKATKEAILKEMGLTQEKLRLIKDDVFGKYIDDVMEATGKVKGRVRMGGGHYKWMGPATKLFERTIGCDEIHNKLKSMSPSGTKTATGRFMAKATQMLHRGFTWGNGKLGALIFIAPLLVDLGVSVSKADKDQKVGTAAHGLVSNMSWIFTFPLALRMLHAVGGIKYAGMSKDDVDKYRQIIKDFNQRVSTTIEKDGMKIPNPNTFKTKAEYDKARLLVERDLKNLRTVKGQNIFTKGLRKLAGVLTLDLGRLNSYRNSSPLANTGRKLPAFFRNFAGIPMRVALWAGLSTVVLEGLLSKGVTAIFGKSYDSMKQDEIKAERKEQKKFLGEDLNQRLYEMQKAKQMQGTQRVAINPIPQQRQNIATRGLNENSKLVPQIEPVQESLVYQAPDIQQVIKPEEENVDNYTYIPSSQNIIPHPKKEDGVDNYTYIPSTECTIKTDKVNENLRKYIPSQEGAKFNKTFDNSGLQSALDRAQKAEAQALRVLSGNFDGM